MRRSVIGAVLAILALASAWRLNAFAQGSPGQDTTGVVKSTRGGLLAKTPQYQFEVFFYSTGVRVFPFTAAGQPVDLAHATGTASFFHPNSPTVWFARPLSTAPNLPGSLNLGIGLGNAPVSGAKVTFEIAGLPGPNESKATFTVPLEFVPQQAGSASASQPTVNSVPRYTYGPGSYGYGYYPYSSPTTASPAPSAYFPYATPSRHYRSDGDSVGAGHRDWSTGRDLGLAKPWMRPMD